MTKSDVTQELWNIKQLKMVTGLSERTLWRLSDSGKTPAAIRISRSVRWRRSDILHWIQLGCPSRKVFEAQSAVAE
ncbi:helix-turn-helix transcriptional regulator [Planctomycetota bacterium]